MNPQPQNFPVMVVSMLFITKSPIVFLISAVPVTGMNIHLYKAADSLGLPKIEPKISDVNNNSPGLMKMFKKSWK